MKVSLNRDGSHESANLDRNVQLFSLFSKLLFIAAIAVLVFLMTSSGFTDTPEIKEQKPNEMLLSSTAPPAPFHR